MPADVTARDLAELMVGSELPKPDTRESTVTDRGARSRVSNLHRHGRGAALLLDDVSFTIHRGEILGVAGVEGNGQSELLEAHHRGSSRRSPARSSSTASDLRHG